MVLFLVVFVIFSLVAILLVRPDFDTVIAATIGIGTLLWFAFWGAVIFVAYHFITKYW